jgi:hypothetical protein
MLRAAAFLSFSTDAARLCESWDYYWQPPKQTTLKIIDVILTIPTSWTFKIFTPYEQAATLVNVT